MQVLIVESRGDLINPLNQQGELINEEKTEDVTQW